MLLVLVGATACTKDELKVQPLTYNDFFTKIWDYEKHPDKFVFEGNTAVIIDFYTQWCRPCRQLAPVLEKMAKEYEGELMVYNVDAEQEKELTAIFKVKGYPAFLTISKKGQYKKLYDGLVTEEELRTIIEEQLLDHPKQK